MRPFKTEAAAWRYLARRRTMAKVRPGSQFLSVTVPGSSSIWSPAYSVNAAIWALESAKAIGRDTSHRMANRLHEDTLRWNGAGPVCRKMARLAEKEGK